MYIYIAKCVAIYNFEINRNIIIMSQLYIYY